MDDDDLRDYAEEAYNRDYCDHCGTTHDENMHLTDDEFDPQVSPLTRAMARGHLLRKGHPLGGYYVPVGRGVVKLVRTCACGNGDES